MIGTRSNELKQISHVLEKIPIALIYGSYGIDLDAAFIALALAICDYYYNNLPLNNDVVFGA